MNAFFDTTFCPLIKSQESGIIADPEFTSVTVEPRDYAEEIGDYCKWVVEDLHVIGCQLSSSRVKFSCDAVGRDCKSLAHRLVDRSITLQEMMACMV
jgi:hypothetical protein